MLTVACVLKGGGSYGPEDVYKLFRGADRHCTQQRSHVCLTDADIGKPADFAVVPLKHDWPGWWAKLELFRSGLMLGPVLYFDLDTVITHDLDEVVAWGEERLKASWADLVMLADRRHSDILGSGIMYWDGKNPVLHRLYERFALDPLYYQRKYRGMPDLGDQAFIVNSLHETDIGVWEEGLFGCLNLDDEATCRGAHACYNNWIPKLPEMATEDSWRGEIVRANWV